MPHHHRFPVSTLLLLCGLVGLALPAPAQTQSLPSRLSDAEFWKLVTNFSEPTGTFPSENFLSNETGYQTVIPELLRTTKPGGVYLGVGPEQNFTYIAALHPAIAFIVDIRRQAVMQHLIYKAVFELADNRADFLSLLFSRPRPAGLDEHSTPEALFAAYATLPLDSATYNRNLERITYHLVKQHRFSLSTDDVLDIAHVYEIICRDATRLTYNSGRGAIQPMMNNMTVTEIIATARTDANGHIDTVRSLVTTSNGKADTATLASTSPLLATMVPGVVYISATPTSGRFGMTPLPLPVSGGRGIGARTYDVLMSATDGAGVQRSFLANEENFRVIRDLERNNLLVPIVGDVSGPKALRSVGQYLHDHGAVVTAYYTSNVEQYLFQHGVSGAFYDNVATLPLDSASTFIRSLPQNELGSIRDLLAAVAAGKVNTYRDLRNYSHQ